MKIKVDRHIKLRNKVSTFVKIEDIDREYNAIRLVQSFSRAIYHNNLGIWELPLEAFKIIVSNYLGDIQISGNLPQEYDRLLNLLDIYDTPDLPYASNTKPYNHQMESFEYSKNHTKFLLSDEQGLGKTKQALDIAVSKKNKTQHCLIVCGVNSLKYNWLHEVGVHTQEKGYILGTRYTKKGKEYIGTIKDRLTDIQAVHLNNAYFLITNIETLRDKAIQKELKKLTEDGIIGITIIDEIHKCKNSTSTQGKAIHCLQSYYKIALTGTPLMNNAIDLYNILKWLEVENHTLTQFKEYYCEMGGYGGYEIVGYRHLDELSSQLNDVMLRRTKKEVLDLPDKLYNAEYLEMTTNQCKIYNDIQSCIMQDIDRIELLPNPLVELTRLRQATGYTGILSTGIEESVKFERMVEWVKEISYRGGKCIVFSNWISIIEPATQLLKDNGIQCISVTSENKNINKDIEEFKNNPDCTAILGTIGVLGTGFTLTEADTVIFLDEPWNRATKEQAEDRAHRIGTKSTVNIVTFICKDTIDERIHELITQKGELSDALIDGAVNKINIRYFLE